MCQIELIRKAFTNLHEDSQFNDESKITIQIEH